ncbi:MAG: arginase [Gammaproteobacteria bacterium]|nr:arginase [Gammaproteobacteria bacterium]
MTVKVFPYAYGNAAGNTGCADGPAHLRDSSILKELPIKLDFQKLLSDKDTKRYLDALKTVAKLSNQLAKLSYAATLQQQAFLTLGGDNTCSIGTWAGAANALTEHGDLGLLWLDAHMDSHTFDTTPSANIHGMPLAALLGFGHELLTSVHMPEIKLKPKNVVLMGIRCYEADEAALLEKLGVRVFYIEEVQERGLHACMQMAIRHITAHTARFGVMLDLDVIAPSEVPAVGTPVKNGIKTKNLLPELEILGQHEKFVGAEICEFNPHLDVEQKTEVVIAQLINALYGKPA